MRVRPEELRPSVSPYQAARERLTEEMWRLNRLPTDRDRRTMSSGLGTPRLSGGQLSVFNFPLRVGWEWITLPAV